MKGSSSVLEEINMGVRSFVENHPASVVGGVVAATVVSTFAVVHFIYSSMHAAEMAASVAQQERLRERLQSIDRGLPQRPYFDVTKLMFQRHDLSTLPTSYRPFRDGKYFVDVPDFGDWEHEETTEARLVADRLGLPDGTLPEALEAPIDVWQDRGGPTLRVPFPAMGTTATFAPTVVVQVVSSAQIRRFVEELFADVAMLELFDRLSTDIGQLEESGATAMTGGLSSALDQVHQAMFDDISGFMLMAILQRDFVSTQVLPGARARTLSVAKKGNVLYLKTMLAIQIPDEASGVSTAVLDREYFVIGGDEEVIMVQIEVPSAFGQGEAFQWTSAWLLGLRIPVAAVALD